MNKITEFIKKSPKAELHLHIEGTLEPSLLFRLAKENNIQIPFSSINEIEAAYKILKEKTDRIAILHCVSAYPTNEKDANLAVINSLKNKFDCVIGQSDHTNNIQVPLYAAAMGAQILEKHYLLDIFLVHK